MISAREMLSARPDPIANSASRAVACIKSTLLAKANAAEAPIEVASALAAKPGIPRTGIKKLLSLAFLAVLASSCVALAGCAADHSAIYQNANNTVQRLSVGPWGEFDDKTLPHAFASRWGDNANRYRWAHLQGITKVDRDTYVQTVARVPDQIGQLHSGDVVDVLFLTIADSNFDQLKSAVVLRVVCKKDGGYECRRKLYDAEGRYYLGPTNEPVPDMSQYTFSKYYDEDGKILPGAKLPE